MRRDLEVLTPEEMGYDGITAEELIESERQCWLDEFCSLRREVDRRRRNRDAGTWRPRAW
jgi:hypothetical protein